MHIFSVKMKIVFSYLAFAFVFFCNAQNQSIQGKWITIDDETGVEKSVVEIYEKEGKIFGKIVRFLEEGANPDAKCMHCKGSMKGKKLMGFNVLRNFSKDGSEYVDGVIIDPENDKTYDAKIWVDEEDNSILKLRGYVSFFYKTISWKRYVE